MGASSIVTVVDSGDGRWAVAARWFNQETLATY
jgi:hypothetical protein